MSQTANKLIQAAAGNSGGIPWDISTADYKGKPLNWYGVIDYQPQPRDLAFKADGTKMYVCGNTGDDVDEYDLSTAWDVSTASYLQSYSFTSVENNPLSVFFKPDGTKMYIGGAQGDDISEFNLSTAWDVSTASYVQNFSVSAQDTQPHGLYFKSDGTKMFVAGNQNDNVSEYTLSTAWDISSATYSQNYSTGRAGVGALWFKSDGLEMYFSDSGTDEIVQCTLTSAWDVSTASETRDFTIIEGNATGLFFKSDGTAMFTLGNKILVEQYALSTAYNISTATFTEPTTDYFNHSSQDGNMQDIAFKTDGSKMYLVGSQNDTIFEYNLSTDWEISTASYVQGFSVAGQEATPTGLFFKSDGTKMFICGTAGDGVDEYSLSTAWDVSTASHNHFFDLPASNENPNGLFFKPDGTKMFVSQLANDSVDEFDLSTAWDVSTASYSQRFIVTTQDNQPYGVHFKDDGTKMYIAGRGQKEIFEYDLSTAWDVSTASYSQSFGISIYQSNPTGVFFKSDGLKFYTADSGAQHVLAFSI